MYSAKKVKEWRKRTKKRIIDSMGGSCVCCGYNKCHGALSLHHIDPKEKEFGFGSIRASAKNWTSIVQELRKCVLVCNNCHSEIHEGMTKIPINANSFNEKFVDYKSMENSLKKKSWLSCPSCGRKVPPHKKYCSYECVGANTKKICVSTASIKKLKEKYSNRQIGVMLGVSDKTVAKYLKG